MFENFKKYCKEKSLDFFLPISFVLAIVPLIVRVKEVKLDGYSASVMGTESTFELFSKYKSFALMFFSIILIGFFLIFRKQILEKKDKIINVVLILSFIFLGLSLVSTLLSPYKEVAMWGVYNRSEGFITTLCYFLLFIYSIFTFKKTEDYKCLLTPILIVVFINAFLGIFQFAGHDLIKTELGKLIVVPKSISEKTGGGNISLLYEKGKLYGTLFHYNYVGSFAAIVIPILFTAMILEYDISYKLTLGMGFLSSLWLLLGSTSRGGLVGIFASLFIAVIIFAKRIFNNKKHILIGLISIIICLVGLNFLTAGTLFERVPSLFKDAFSIFSNTNDVNYKDLIPVKDIKNENGTVNVVFKDKTLNIKFENNKYTFTCDGDKIKVNKTEQEENLYTLDSSYFSNVSFKLTSSSKSSDKMDILKLFLDNDINKGFLFRVKEDNTIHLVNATLSDIDIEEPASIGFKGKEKLGSERGYIWSRSLPLLKDCIFKGKGPDTFMLYFPQNDLLAKYYAYDNPNTLVDKPHNLYLGIALGNGITALIAFILIMLIYVVDSLRLYALKTEYEESQIFGIATCLGVIGYLAAGMFNDSIISVAPVFWIVLGVGFALNYINKKSLKK